MRYVEQADLGEGVVQVRLRNGVTNAIHLDLLHELHQVVDAMGAETRGLLLVGGEKFFSIGLDLPWGLAQPRAVLRTLFNVECQLVLRLLALRIPVVGAMQAHAIGAGTTLLMACDYRYGPTGRALLGLNEVRIGVPNPYFADQLLRLLAGDGVASDLICSGRLETAEAWVKLGLMHGAFAKDEVEIRALAHLRELAGLHQPAFALNKTMRTEELCERIRRRMEGHLDELLDIWFTDTTQGLLRSGLAAFHKG